MAEIVGEYLRKGSKIYVEGSLRTRKWQDKSCIERHTTEIIANEMHILDSRSGSAHQGLANLQESKMDDSSKAIKIHPQPMPAEVTQAIDEFEDDIPF